MSNILYIHIVKFKHMCLKKVIYGFLKNHMLYEHEQTLALVEIKLQAHSCNEAGIYLNVNLIVFD